ncbi:MAG: YHS domain-containing protein, partial [Rhodospirillales bacterium]|nr:YHS domain-containing protein [Rhodospirillales bacterium]
MSHAHTHSCCSTTAASPASVRDPVCGMSVDPAKTPHRADHNGQSFAFCCAGCRTKF